MSTEIQTISAQPIPTVANALTPKQQLFIKHYVTLSATATGKRGYGTEAARLAGYKGDESTLSSVAAENLTKPAIRAEITRLFNPIADAEEVLARLTKYSRSSIADVLDGSGEFDIDFAKENHSDDLIKKLKIKRRVIPVKDGEPETEITHEIELYSAHEATRDLAKVHKLLTERTEIETKESNPTEIARAILEEVQLLHQERLKALESKTSGE